MKKILIVNNNLHIGGVQRALVDLLKSICDRYEVTLLLFSPEGELADQIPPNVKIISPCWSYKAWGITKDDRVGAGIKLLRVFFAGITRTIGRGAAIRIADLFQRKINGFDAAISFLHSPAPKVFYGGCNEFVLHKVDTPLKATFLHCDYENISAASNYNVQVYKGFDRIAACSDGCREAFLRSMQGFEKKTCIVHNFHDYPRIRERAYAEPIVFEKNKFNILSVARFGNEKGILRAIKALNGLFHEYDGLRYYIVGTGRDYPRAAKMICEFGLTGKMILLGERTDPYGYMKAADVLLIPSVSEAAPLVIDEAACLGTPVLTTETSSAKEMVSERDIGWVCDNSPEGICTSIERLMRNPDELARVKETLSGMTFDNSIALKEFEELLD